MKSQIICGILVLTGFSANCQNLKTNKQSEENMMTNTEKAMTINKAVQSADLETAASLVKEDYIQHTPVVPDGKKGLIALLTKIKNGEIPAPKINTIRSFEDGGFVILHHEVHWPNRKAMVEIFRFEDGLAAEHWSGIMDHPKSTASGNSMFDGPTTITDQTKTKENKTLTKSFVETVLIRGEFNRISEFYHQEIIQHNPFIDNTINGLINGIQDLQKEGITFQVEKLHYVFGEGNFVLTFSEGKFKDNPAAFFDLFRVENGKIVEHWDVIQEVPEQMAHNNGMF